MKKVRLSLGVAAFAVAFIAALATGPKAHAVKYWRFSPGQIAVNPSTDCDPDPAALCANIYNDAGTQQVGTVSGDYNK